MCLHYKYSFTDVYCLCCDTKTYYINNHFDLRNLFSSNNQLYIHISASNVVNSIFTGVDLKNILSVHWYFFVSFRNSGGTTRWRYRQETALK